MQEGLKELNRVLNSDDFLHVLDHNTLATTSTSKIKGQQKLYLLQSSGLP